MKSKRSNLTIFSVLTTITILTWVVFDAYQRFTKTEVKDIPASVLAPINPSLNRGSLDNIEAKLFFGPEEVAQFTPAPTRSTPPPPEEEEEASPQAEEQE